jgi:phage tail-like protein
MTEIVRRNTGLRATARRPARSADWMLNQLPVGMLESDFFVRFVSIFQEIGSTLIADADNVDNVADLSVTPEAMIPWLGSWIGVDSVDPSLPPALQRRIVESSADTIAWRGTVSGLTRFLELTSDGPVQVTDGGGVWRDGEAPADTAWVKIQVESTGWLPESDFIALVRDEIPAHVRAELYVGERLIWVSDREGSVRD